MIRTTFISFISFKPRRPFCLSTHPDLWLPIRTGCIGSTRRTAFTPVKADQSWLFRSHAWLLIKTSNRMVIYQTLLLPALKSPSYLIYYSVPLLSKKISMILSTSYKTETLDTFLLHVDAPFIVPQITHFIFTAIVFSVEGTLLPPLLFILVWKNNISGL